MRKSNLKRIGLVFAWLGLIAWYLYLARMLGAFTLGLPDYVVIFLVILGLFLASCLISALFWVSAVLSIKIEDKIKRN